MCGIAGWFDNEIDMSKQIPVLYKMSQTLSKRGPDENGLYIVLCCTDGLLLLTKKTANSLWRHDTEEKHI